MIIPEKKKRKKRKKKIGLGWGNPDYYGAIPAQPSETKSHNVESVNESLLVDLIRAIIASQLK